MVGNTEVEKRIKNDIANELEFYGKDVNGSNNKALLSVNTFLSAFSKKSTLFLFSKQGVEEIKKYLKDNSDYPNIVEFLYRIKTSFYTNKEIYRIVFDMLKEDIILDEIMKEEFTRIDIKTPEDLEKYYVSIVLYISNNIVITKGIKK